VKLVLVVAVFVLGLLIIPDENSFAMKIIDISWIVHGQEYLENTPNTNSLLSCNCVAFRLDDIMDYKKTEAQIQVIKAFMDNDVPLTVGVTANKFGDDQKLVDFIKEQLKNSDNLEIANHGWNHESFNQFTRQHQSTLINQTNTKLYEILGISPTVFIPPFNNFEKTTIGALQDNGMTHMSSALFKDPSPYPLTNSTFYRFPTGATTGTVDSWTQAFLVLPHEVTYTGVKESLYNNGFAVVMMHPKEFSIKQADGSFSDDVNWDQINELKLLIKKIQDDGLTIVPIGKINLDSESTDIPEWIKNNAGWWADGSISQNEFLQAVEFLIKQKILIVSDIPSSQTTEPAPVPEWIKNNAAWWASGEINDEAFVAGIQFLIKQGIIQV